MMNEERRQAAGRLAAYAVVGLLVGLLVVSRSQARQAQADADRAAVHCLAE